jgi:hypothetical protein
VSPTPVAQLPADASPDLVVEDIAHVEAATMLIGPAYSVKFRNQGTAHVGKFRVILVAGLDGQVYADSPQAVIDVAGLEPGQAGQVTLRLPKSAMQLVSSNGQASAFTHLVVAVDADGTVRETDETNNSAMVERVQLEGAH